MSEEERLGVYVAVARVVYLLYRGAYFTTPEVADLIGRSRVTAYRLLTELESSHHVPVYFDTALGAWKLLQEETTT